MISEQKAVSCLRAVMKSAALEYGKSVHIDEQGSVCLITDVGDLCALPVPSRCEIEVSLLATRGPTLFRYPLFSIQGALGQEAAAIMFSEASFEEALGKFEILLSNFLKSARDDPNSFLAEIDKIYSFAIEYSSAQERRARADSLWVSGDIDAAAKLYSELPARSALEEKRLSIARSRKGSR